MSSMGKKDLYLHIGVHRTATTAIQATMFKNWNWLKNQGYLYPFGVERHIGMFNNLFRGAVKPHAFAADLAKRVDSHDAPIHTVVMSDEDVSMRSDISILAPFVEFFNVKIIFAMRRQDLWLESWWAQNVKGQWDRELCHMPWPEFIANRQRFHWINYDYYLKHLENIFGLENIRPYVFEKMQMPEGPIAAFCRQFGLENAASMEPAGGSNISLSPEVSEFVRYLPLIEAKMDVRLALIDMAEAVDRSIRAEKPATLLIPHSERRVIMDEYAAGNAAVAYRYFGRDELFLEALPPADAPVAIPRLPDRPEDVMTRLVAPFLQELVRRKNDQI